MGVVFLFIIFIIFCSLMNWGRKNYSSYSLKKVVHSFKCYGCLCDCIPRLTFQNTWLSVDRTVWEWLEVLAECFSVGELGSLREPCYCQYALCLLLVVQYVHSQLFLLPWLQSATRIPVFWNLSPIKHALYNMYCSWCVFTAIIR